LFVYARDVAAKSAGADPQIVFDFLVTKSFGQLIEDIPFARRELLDFGIGLRRLLKMLDDAPGHFRAHWRTAFVDFLNRFEQFVWRGALEQIAAGAGGQGFE